MVRAGALIFALCISLILLILSSSLVLLAFSSRAVFNDLQIDENLISNVSSSLNYYLANSTEWEGDSIKTIDLFEKGEDSVDIEASQWGMFQVLHCRAHQGRHMYESIFLTGTKCNKNATALYLADRNKPLSLCGRTVIKGNCYLPKQGVKRAYIEGENFVGDKLIDGVTSDSKEELPSFGKGISSDISFLKFTTSNDSSVAIEQLQTNKMVSNSFYGKTITLIANNNIELENYSLQGNIVIRCSGEVKIKSNNVLKDIIVKARKIVIDENFSGNLQAFASDSILVKENVQLHYPSVLCILSNKDQSLALPVIDIKRNASIKGCVINFAAPNITARITNIEVDEKAKITGLLYSNGYVGFKGSITGSLYCTGFILKTPSAVYDNHLLNAEINSTLLPSYFSGCFPQPDIYRSELISKLE